MKTPIPAFNPLDWFNYGRWVQPPLSGCFWSPWYTTHSVQSIFPSTPFHAMLFLDGHSLTKRSDKDSMLVEIKKMDRDGTINSFIDTFETVGEKVKQNHLNVLNNSQDGIVYLNELFDTYQEVAGVWWLALQLADELELHLLQQYSSVDPKEIIKQVESVRRPTWLEEQSIEIKKIAELIRKDHPSVTQENVLTSFAQNPPIHSAITDHVKKFQWFGTHHWGGEPYTFEKCVEDVRKELNKNNSINLSKMKNENAPPLIRLMAVLSFWRTHGAEVTAKVVFESRPMMEKVAAANGLSYEEFTYLSSREIMAYLKEGKKLPNKLPERKSKWGNYFDEEGIEHIFAGAKIESLLSRVIEKNETTITEIKGMVASKNGVVRGIAKVVISPDDFKSFQEGDILIAPETTPDFVPLMKKAKAVVTDRGGITSHAAIVSRELGVACIIGTGKATQVFHTNDRIEVDTEKGIVKKL